MTQGRLEAVVFDLIYTLVFPGEFPGGGDRTRWIAGLLGMSEPELEGLWDAFELELETGKAPSIAPLGPELTWLVEVAAHQGRPIEPSLLQQIEKDWDLTRRQALLMPREVVTGILVAIRSAGFRIGVLSNTHALELRSWPESPLVGLVDVVVLSHEIGAMKPDPASYAEILRRLGVRASVCAYVGDGSNDELAGARRAGFALVVLASEFAAKFAPDRLPVLRSQADIAVESISELPTLLSQPTNRNGE